MFNLNLCILLLYLYTLIFKMHLFDQADGLTEVADSEIQKLYTA